MVLYQYLNKSQINIFKIFTHNNYINLVDFIEFLQILKPYNQDIDIMLECKAKDEALFRLVRQLKTKTNYYLQP